MALSDLFNDIGHAARGSVRRGQGLDALISSLKGEEPVAAQETPSPFERGVSYVFEKAPVLRDVLMHFAKLGSTVANVAEAGVYGLQGKGDEALGSLGAAGRQFTDFITNTLGAPVEAVGRLFGADDVVPNLSRPTDFRSFSNVLQTAGVGKLGEVDLPVLGKVTGRGALGLGLDVLTDPLTFTKVGALTKEGRLARNAGTGVIRPEVGGKLGSLAAAQAKAGERALLQIGGKTIIRGAPVLGTFERMVDVLKNHPRSPFKSFTLYSKPEMREASLAGRMGRGLSERSVRESTAMTRLDADIRRIATERGVPEATVAEEVLAAKEKLPVPRFAKEARREDIWRQIQRAEKKGLEKKAGRLFEEHRAAKLDVDRVADEAGRARLRTLMAQYVSEGYTKTEAYRAATAAILKGVPEEIAPLAASADRVLRGILQDENIRGVTVEALSDPYKSYITTAFSDEFKQWLRKNRKDPMRGEPAFRRWSAKHPSTLRRDVIFEGRPVAEIEQEMRKHFPEYAGRIFETDPRALIGRIRAERFGRGIGTSRYVETAAKHLARAETPELLEAGWMRLGDVAQKSGKVLPADEGLLRKLGLRPEREAFRGGEKVPTGLKPYEGMVVPPEIAAEMIRTTKLASQTPPNILLSLLDGFTRGFKTGATVPFLAFYLRNALTNFWQNFLGGVWNPKSYTDAGQIVYDAAKGGGAKAWDVGAGRAMTSKQIIDHMDAGGALGYTGTFSEEELLKGAVEKIPVLKQMRRWGGVEVESNAKIAHFIEKMRKGYSPEDAVLSVRKYLFDYGELSPIEKNFFRRVIPFYTFQRKSWPLILESMVTQPGKMAAAAHFDAAMRARADGGGPIETTVLPGYISRRLLKIDEDKDGTLSVLSGFGLPFEDIAFMDRPWGDLVSMLNPLIKGPLQHLTNTDYFRDIPLDRSEYAPAFLRWAEHIPGVGKPFLDAIGFREIKPDVYRANPRFLNWLWTLGASTQRGAGIASLASTDPAAAVTKYLSPLRNQTYTPQQQIRENYRKMVEGYVGRLEELQRAGVTGRAEDFYVRRDMLPDSPAVIEARRLNRELGVFKSLLGRMSAAERAQARQEGLRSGGQ